VVLPVSTAVVQLYMQEIINEKHIVIFYIYFHSWHCILCWAEIHMSWAERFNRKKGANSLLVSKEI